MLRTGKNSARQVDVFDTFPKERQNYYVISTPGHSYSTVRHVWLGDLLRENPCGEPGFIQIRESNDMSGKLINLDGINISFPLRGLSLEKSYVKNKTQTWQLHDERHEK